MAVWSVDLKCGQQTFVLEVNRPTGVLLSDWKVTSNGNSSYTVVIDYITDANQTDPGPDLLDSAVRVPGDCTFSGAVNLDRVQVNEFTTRRTCP